MVKFFEDRKARKEIEKEIDELEKDLEKGFEGFFYVIKFEQRKINILSSIKDLWQKNWKKAEDFIKKLMPKLINEQLKVLGEDIKLAEENEKLIVRLLTEGDLGKSYYAWDNKTRQLFSELVKNKKELEKEVIGLFEPIRIFYINLGKNLRKQLNFFESEKVWDLINQSQQYLNEIKRENEQIQKFIDFYQKRHSMITYHIKTLKVLIETDFDDPKTIKDFLEKVKENCGFHLYATESGYRMIYQKNIHMKTREFIERICELPAGIIGKKIRSILYPGHANYSASLDCNETIFHQAYNAPTKEVLTKGNDERPTIFIYYSLREEGIGRIERVTATLILGAEDAAKFLIYFKKNPSKIYDFFRAFHDRFNTQRINRNGRILFVPTDLNEIIISEYHGQYGEHYLFNVKEEFFKNFILTY